jgi:isoleucyl-tRNA synthetase
LPLRNSYYFYSTYAGIDKFTPGSTVSLRDIDLASLSHPLDRWMVMKTMELVNTVDSSMQAYDMQTASISLIEFMDDLTNRYIRRSRRRFWENGAGDDMGSDKRQAYTVLYCVLTEVCLVAAPFTPFIAEYIYKQLTGKESVHLEEIETYDNSVLDHTLINDMKLTQTIVSL